MCDEKERLRKAFDEAADAFSQAIPDMTRQELLGVSVDIEKVLTAVVQRLEETQDEYERHMKKHRC